LKNCLPPQVTPFSFSGKDPAATPAHPQLSKVSRKTAGHEFVHVQLLFRHVANPTSTNWRHPDPVVDAKTKKAESELNE